jgi:hypothetical protein
VAAQNRVFSRRLPPRKRGLRLRPAAESICTEKLCGKVPRISPTKFTMAGKIKMPDNKKNNALIVSDAMHKRFTSPPDFYVSSLGVCVRNPEAQKIRSMSPVTEEDFDEPPDLPASSTPAPSAPPPPDFTRLISTVTEHAARLQAENTALRETLAEYKARELQASEARARRLFDSPPPRVAETPPRRTYVWLDPRFKI